MYRFLSKALLGSIALLFAITLLFATTLPSNLVSAEETIYDEDKLPSFKLPDPLLFANGDAVTSADAWRNKRRPEVFKLFEEHVYGRVPKNDIRFVARTDSVNADALGGKAIQKLVTLSVEGKPDGPSIQLLVYLPKSEQTPHPVPAFVGLNFRGNHTVQPDPAIPLTQSWVGNRDGITTNRATEEHRGIAAGRWPVERIVERGLSLIHI